MFSNQQDSERLNSKLTILGQMTRNIKEMTMLNYKLPQKDSCFQTQLPYRRQSPSFVTILKGKSISIEIVVCL